MPAAPLPPNEGGRLAALSALGLLDTPRSPEFDIYPALAHKAFATPAAAISLVDKGRQWFKASVGLDMTETDRSTSFCAHAILHPDEVLCVPDATRDRRFADNKLVTGPPGFRFYAGVPIAGPDGHALGAVCVFDHKPREASPALLQTLKELAIGVESAIKLHAADRAARQAVARERESRMLFAATFARIGAPVALVRNSGEFVTTNPALQQLLGYSADEMHSLRVNDLTPPEHMEAMRAARAKQMEDGQRYDVSITTFAKGGRRVAVRLTSALLKDGDDRMRVVTLIPAVPAPVQAVPMSMTRDAGELRAVSLEAFRKLFGADWERIAERALQRAEQIIRRRLGRDDVVSRVDDKFVIWFQSRDQDRNEETLTKIVRDIRIQFTTEFGAQTADHVGAVLVPGGGPGSGTPAGKPVATPAPAVPRRPVRPAVQAEQVAAVGWLT